MYDDDYPQNHKLPVNGNIVQGAYWIANSLLRNQGLPLMQIRCLHNAISSEVTKAPGIKKPHIVVVQSFAVFLLEAEHFDVLTGPTQHLSKSAERTYVSGKNL